MEGYSTVDAPNFLDPGLGSSLEPGFSTLEIGTQVRGWDLRRLGYFPLVIE